MIILTTEAYRDNFDHISKKSSAASTNRTRFYHTSLKADNLTDHKLTVDTASQRE